MDIHIFSQGQDVLGFLPGGDRTVLSLACHPVHFGVAAIGCEDCRVNPKGAPFKRGDDSSKGLKKHKKHKKRRTRKGLKDSFLFCIGTFLCKEHVTCVNWWARLAVNKDGNVLLWNFRPDVEGHVLCTESRALRAERARGVFKRLQ